MEVILIASHITVGHEKNMGNICKRNTTILASWRRQWRGIREWFPPHIYCPPRTSMILSKLSAVRFQACHISYSWYMHICICVSSMFLHIFRTERTIFHSPKTRTIFLIWVSPRHLSHNACFLMQFICTHHSELAPHTMESLISSFICHIKTSPCDCRSFRKTKAKENK